MRQRRGVLGRVARALYGFESFNRYDPRGDRRGGAFGVEGSQGWHLEELDVPRGPVVEQDEPED